MAIKKVVIKNENLPPINSEIEGYLVRYRIVSEDGNRISHWSSPYFLDPGLTYTPGQFTIAKASSHVTLIWNSVSINKNGTFIRYAKEYDIWVKWGKAGLGDWKFEERLEGTSLLLNIPETFFVDGLEVEEKPNELTVEVYIKAEPAARNSKFLVYAPPLETV